MSRGKKLCYLGASTIFVVLVSVFLIFLTGKAYGFTSYKIITVTIPGENCDRPGGGGAGGAPCEIREETTKDKCVKYADGPCERACYPADA